MKLKKLIKELEDEYYYLALYIEGNRVFGDFCYNEKETLVDYLNLEVLDITPSENAKVIKVDLEKSKEEKIPEPIIEKKEEKADGKKRRNTTSRKGVKVS